MSLNTKIPGPPLAGFADFFEENVSFGATKGSTKPPAKPAKLVGGVSRQPSRTSSAHSPHKAAVMSMAKAGQAAIAAGKAGAARVAKHVADGKAGKLAVPAAAAPGGARATAVGAPAMTAKQKAAVAAHSTAVAKSNAAAIRLAQMSKKAAADGKAALEFSKKLIPYFKAKLSGKTPPQTRVKGLDGLIGSYIEASGGVDQLGDDEILGLAALMGDASIPPDPNNPGFLMDGSPDPTGSVSASTSALDPSTSGAGVVTAPDGTVLYDPSTDPAIVPLPTRGGKLSPEDAQAPWQNVPDDGIVYDGSKGWPRYSKASCFYFFGPQNANGGQFGMVWGYDHMNWPNSPDPVRWGKRMGQAAVTNNDNWDDGCPSDAAAAAESTKGDPRNMPPDKDYGPLIGNPTGSMGGLQYAIADDKWFWQSANAPSWATAEADAKIKQANAKTIAANRAAAQVQVAQMAKDAADQKAAQAAQEAQIALAETAAASQANIAESQRQTQTQQLEIDQSKADLAQQAVETAQSMQAGQLLMEQVRRQLSQPQQPVHMQQRGHGHRQDDEVPDLMADGLPVPGAENMQDLDGEGYQDDSEE